MRLSDILYGIGDALFDGLYPNKNESFEGAYSFRKRVLPVPFIFQRDISADKFVDILTDLDIVSSKEEGEKFVEWCYNQQYIDFGRGLLRIGKLDYEGKKYRITKCTYSWEF